MKMEKPSVAMSEGFFLWRKQLFVKITVSARLCLDQTRQRDILCSGGRSGYEYDDEIF